MIFGGRLAFCSARASATHAAEPSNCLRLITPLFEHCRLGWRERFGIMILMTGSRWRVLVACLLGAVSLPAHAASYAISGTVRGSGSALGGITITLSGAQSATTTT